MDAFDFFVQMGLMGQPLIFLYNGSDKTPCEKIIKLKSYDNHCYFSSLHFSRLGVSCECKI